MVALIINSCAFPTLLGSSKSPKTLFNVRELVHDDQPLFDPYGDLLNINVPVEEELSPSVILENSITMSPAQRPRATVMHPWERHLRKSIYDLNKNDKQRRLGESEEKRKDRKAFKKLMIDTLEVAEGMGNG
ncbi:hypothetical protein EON65_40215 [archaeon]|nr:MAG: hypothetical protein EON65_40215 [archaeon]